MPTLWLEIVYRGSDTPSIDWKFQLNTPELLVFNVTFETRFG